VLTAVINGTTPTAMRRSAWRSRASSAAPSTA
jgi:hypothetical protein